MPDNPPTVSVEQRDLFRNWERAHFARMAELAREGMARKARRGILPGTAPIGYVNVHRRIEVDPEYAQLVRESFERAANSNLPLRALLAEMTAKGLVSHKGKPIQIGPFWHILRNPFYVGMIRYRGELIKGVHEPLVDRKTWDAVQGKRP